MRYDKTLVAEKLLRWERFMGAFQLPAWNDLPRIALYMDQVIALINQYLGFFVFDPEGEKLLTPSMVNNYVKQRLLPPPVRKKYGRKHIALLIMICTLKQSIGMSAVAGMLPPDDEAVIQQEYERFAASYLRISRYVVEQAKQSAAPVFNADVNTGAEVNDLIIGAAVAASFARLFAGKLISLGAPEEPAEPAPPPDGEPDA